MLLLLVLSCSAIVSSVLSSGTSFAKSPSAESLSPTWSSHSKFHTSWSDYGVVAAQKSFFSTGCAASTNEFFVDCLYGNDSWNGSYSTPFLTLSHARDVIRSLELIGKDSPRSAPSGSVTVNVFPGVCYPSVYAAGAMSPLLELDAAVDSGTSDVIISYTGFTNAESLPVNSKPRRDDIPQYLQDQNDRYAASNTTLLSGGVLLDPSLWQPSTTMSNVFVYNLTAVGLTQVSLGSIYSGGLGQCAGGFAELFFNEQPMVLARYPNQLPNGSFTWTQVTSVLNASTFVWNSDRALRWQNESAPYLHGYWNADWAVRVEQQ
jgi:hypothetical protein